MSPRRVPDPNQLEIDFCQQIDQFCEYTKAIAERAQAPAQLPTDEPVKESKAELYVELAAACKQAIRDSGLSREEVLERINEYYSVSDDAEGSDGSESSRPTSIHVFNNHLSKPHECRMPTWLLLGIIVATDNLTPLDVLASRRGATVISANERAELLVGKLEQHLKEGAAIKRQLSKMLSGRGR